MRAIQFVPIEPNPDRRSHPTRKFVPDTRCAWHRKGDATHKRAKWTMRIIVDWKPDNCGHPVCEDCKAEWGRDNLVLPLNVVVKPKTGAVRARSYAAASPAPIRRPTASR